jgi:AraC-like DNA-binding protein
MQHDLTGLPRLGDGLMRAAAFVHLPALLKSQGISSAAFVKAAGLTLDSIAHPENVIPIRKGVRLLMLGAAQTGRPHFGLFVGQRTSLKQYGLIGVRMLNAPTVGVAWRGLVLTLHLNDRVNVPALTVRDQVATLSFTHYREFGEGAPHVMDYTLAAACVAMRALCGTKWAPSEVHFAHRPPADERPYRSFFRAPVHFGTTRTALLFPASLLDRRIEAADPALRRAIEELIAATMRDQDLTLIEKVRRALFVQITEDDVSIEDIARMLGLHKRTLNRRLAEIHTSFARLLGEVRYQLARELLIGTDLALIDIAAALHYTDASAFSRAFRSWSGTTPTAWRQAESNKLSQKLRVAA